MFSTEQYGFKLHEFIAPLQAIRQDRLSGLGRYALAVDRLIAEAVVSLINELKVISQHTGIDFAHHTERAIGPFLSLQRLDEASSFLTSDEHMLWAAEQLGARLLQFRDVFEECTVFALKGPLMTVRENTKLLLSKEVQEGLSSIFLIRQYIRRHMEHFLALRGADNPHDGIINFQICLNKLISDCVALEQKSYPTDYRHAAIRIETAEVPLLCGDEPRLRSALRELLRNAVYSTMIRCGADMRLPYRERSQVFVKTESNGRNQVVVSITDNGIGIPSNELPRVSRFGTSKSFGNVHFGGLGIGIPIASAIFQELGGQLTYLSDRLRGTTARVTLPLPDGELLKTQSIARDVH